MGSLIGDTKCEIIAIFLPLSFYVKSILADFRLPKTAVLEALNFDFGKISHFKILKVFNNSKFRGVQMV